MKHKVRLTVIDIEALDYHIFPMPVLLISTFNEDGSVDVMNAA